jgi:peptidoglycan/xylan/chitin deacetylase (PgdA/CDA1 family)
VLPRDSIPDRLVVLTFDDASKSHFTVARPLLKKYGFGATFFVTEGFEFPTNKRDYMTWDEIAQLHKDGFEIGNHTRDHKGITRDTLPDLAAQLRGISVQCEKHGIPVPISFAYPGNVIERNALPILKNLGIQFARRGGGPEYPYKEGNGFAYEPGLDHRLLIPSAGDARPGWTLADPARTEPASGLGSAMRPSGAGGSG